MMAIHVLTHKSAGHRPTQKSYKKHFLFRKECGQPYDFCRATDRNVLLIIVVYDL